MRTTEVELFGAKYALCLNAAAMFEIEDQIGTDAIEKAGKTSSEGLDALSMMAAIMMEQGELVRRYMGYDPGKILSATAIRLMLTPADVLVLREKVIRAYLRGFGREIDQDDEIDLGLTELQKKTESQDRKSCEWVR